MSVSDGKALETAEWRNEAYSPDDLERHRQSALSGGRNGDFGADQVAARGSNLGTGGVDEFCRANQHCLDGSVLTVSDPAPDASRLAYPGNRRSEADTLDVTVPRHPHCEAIAGGPIHVSRETYGRPGSHRWRLFHVKLPRRRCGPYNPPVDPSKTELAEGSR